VVVLWGKWKEGRAGRRHREVRGNDVIGTGTACGGWMGLGSRVGSFTASKRHEAGAKRLTPTGLAGTEGIGGVQGLDTCRVCRHD